jgi:hypothetical protein
MPYNIHDLGDVIRVSAAFINGGTDDPIDPDVVKLSIRTPAGVVTTHTYGIGGTIVKEAVGQYFAHIDANQAGFWFYRWWSTGLGQAARENEFKVRGAQAV